MFNLRGHKRRLKSLERRNVKPEPPRYQRVVVNAWDSFLAKLAKRRVLGTDDMPLWRVIVRPDSRPTDSMLPEPRVSKLDAPNSKSGKERSEPAEPDPYGRLRALSTAQLHSLGRTRIPFAERLAVEAELNRRQVAARTPPPPPDPDALRAQLRARYEIEQEGGIDPRIEEASLTGRRH